MSDQRSNSRENHNLQNRETVLDVNSVAGIDSESHTEVEGNNFTLFSHPALSGYSGGRPWNPVFGPEDRHVGITGYFVQGAYRPNVGSDVGASDVDERVRDLFEESSSSESESESSDEEFVITVRPNRPTASQRAPVQSRAGTGRGRVSQSGRRRDYRRFDPLIDLAARRPGRGFIAHTSTGRAYPRPRLLRIPPNQQN